MQRPTQTQHTGMLYFLGVLLAGFCPRIEQPHFQFGGFHGRQYPKHTFERRRRRKLKGYMKRHRSQ